MLNCAQKNAHIPPQKNSRQYRHGCSSWRHPTVFGCQTLTQLVDSSFGHAVTYHTCGWDGLFLSPLQKIQSYKRQKLNVTAQEWRYWLSSGQVEKKTSTNLMEGTSLFYAWGTLVQKNMAERPHKTLKHFSTLLRHFGVNFYLTAAQLNVFLHQHLERFCASPHNIYGPLEEC